MNRPIGKVLLDVLKLMDAFKYTSNDDSLSTSFFEAELPEDGFFILRNEIEAIVKSINHDQ